MYAMSFFSQIWSISTGLSFSSSIKLLESFPFNIPVFGLTTPFICFQVTFKLYQADRHSCRSATLWPKQTSPANSICSISELVQSSNNLFYVSSNLFHNVHGDGVAGLLVKLGFGINSCGSVELFIRKALEPETLSRR
nr:MAG TPA: hypothetical protein [Caudoviricetes sp.]